MHLSRYGIPFILWVLKLKFLNLVIIPLCALKFKYINKVLREPANLIILMITKDRRGLIFSQVKIHFVYNFTCLFFFNTLNEIFLTHEVNLVLHFFLNIEIWLQDLRGWLLKTQRNIFFQTSRFRIIFWFPLFIHGRSYNLSFVKIFLNFDNIYKCFMI